MRRAALVLGLTLVTIFTGVQPASAASAIHVLGNTGCELILNVDDGHHGVVTYDGRIAQVAASIPCRHRYIRIVAGSGSDGRWHYSRRPVVAGANEIAVNVGGVWFSKRSFADAVVQVTTERMCYRYHRSPGSGVNYNGRYSQHSNGTC